METFLGLLPLFIISALIFSAIVWFRRNRVLEAPGPIGQTPYGVHGILAFFIYTSLTLGPLFSLGRTAQELEKAEQATPELVGFEAWETYTTLSWASTFIFIALAVFLVLRLKKKFVPGSVRSMKAFLLLAPVSQLAADAGLTVVLFGDVDGGAVAVALIPAMVPSLIWFLYFTFSKRVRNTYFSAAAKKTFGSDTQFLILPSQAHSFQPDATSPPAQHPTWNPSGHGDTSASSADGHSMDGTESTERDVKLAILERLHDSELISDMGYEKRKDALLERL